MPDNQLDDFRAITDAEGMWFGPFDRDDLFRLIRLETEEGLRRQVSDSVLERIETFGSPLYLLLAREMDDLSKVKVGHVAFAVRADTCFRERVMAFRADVPEPPAVH